MTRGYFGIGIENCKTGHNLGTLWRSAHNLGASYIFVIGQRYRLQASDTTKAYRNIPLYHFVSFDEFYSNLPFDCQLVGVEFPHDGAQPLPQFIHPERCVYLLGAEDHGLSKQALAKCHKLVYIPSLFCMNVAVAGSILMYDRSARPQARFSQPVAA